ncbi:DUF927 domain-containing protein [Salmonella enterica]|nr:DUF927 domain-containing protein [Salmonella enterica]
MNVTDIGEKPAQPGESEEALTPTANDAEHTEDAGDNVVSIESARLPFIQFSPFDVKMRRVRTVRGVDIEELVAVCHSDFKIVGWAEHQHSDLRIVRLYDTLRKKPVYFPIPTSLVGFSDGWKLLQSKGAKVETTPALRSLFARYLLEDSFFLDDGQREGKLEKFEVITQTGWTEDLSAYVFADGDAIYAYGRDASKTIVDLGQDKKHFCNTHKAGTKEGWCKEVAPLLAGNDILTLVVGAALAGPLLELVGARGFGVHLFGGTSKGKTTSMYIANSIYGHPEDRVLPWDMTPFALGHLAAIHNHSLITIDELKQAKAKELARAIYGVFNGRLRVQGDKEGGLKAPIIWNTMMLSTGELTVDQHIRLVLGEDIDAGALVRLLNVPYQEPQNLHGFADGQKFAVNLLAICKKHHGAFGRWWVEQVAAKQQVVIDQYNQAIKRWDGITQQYKQGSFSRVGNHFALIETALILASKHLGMTEATIRDTMVRLFNNWLSGFTTDTEFSHEESNVIQRGISALQQYHKFAPANLAKHAQEPTGEIWGLKDSNFFYFYRDKFNELVAGNMNPTDAAKTLERAGMLIPFVRKDNGKKSYSKGFVQSHEGNTSRPITYRMKMPEGMDMDIEGENE